MGRGGAWAILGLVLTAGPLWAVDGPVESTGPESGSRGRHVRTESVPEGGRRLPGIFAEAAPPPERVDPQQLAARQRAIYSGQGVFTRVVSSAGAAKTPGGTAGPESVGGDRAGKGARGGAVTGPPTTAWIVLAALVSAAVVWAAVRRRARMGRLSTAGASSRTGASRRPRRGKWLDRDLRITMGQGRE
jgi:hypothetical protein